MISVTSVLFVVIIVPGPGTGNNARVSFVPGLGTIHKASFRIFLAYTLQKTELTVIQSYNSLVYAVYANPENFNKKNNELHLIIYIRRAQIGKIPFRFRENPL